MGAKRSADPVKRAERNASIAPWGWRAYVVLAVAALVFLLVDRNRTVPVEITSDTVLGFLAFLFSVLATYLMVAQLENAHAQMLRVQDEQRRKAISTVTYETQT